MQKEIRRAVTLLHRIAPGVIARDLAGLRLAAQPLRGHERDLPQALLRAQSAVHFHGIRALLNAGADTRERLGLLVDGDLTAGLAQRRRHGEPADSGSD